jgi:glycosyltransferase involved in cell wall biosynthesis
MTEPERARRLCMVLHGPYPEPRVAREAAAAIAAGYAVDVVATRRTGEPAHESVDGVTVTRLPVRHVQGAGIGRVFGEYLVFATLATGVVGARAISQRYDVVHVHNPPDFLIVSALIPRLLGSRVIFDIHDRSPDMFSMRFPGRVGARATVVLQRLERLATALADAVVTVHDPYLRELVALGTPAEKATVVMNSLDERLVPSPKQRTPGPFRVVYHGTVTPHYGVHVLVDAVAETVRRGLDVRVEIIGGGDSVPDLSRRVAALGLSDRIAVEGRFLPHKTVLDRVNGASVGVIPNLPTPLNRFALSSKLFEYVVLGVPVISAALPTIQEYFSDDEVQFFEPGSADSLAEALLAVASDPEGAESRAQRARRRYAPYRWEVNARAYVGILDQLSAGRKPSALGATHAGRGEPSS